MTRRLVPWVALVATACVQPAYDRTVVYDVELANDTAAATVGVRGNDRPLLWERDAVLERTGPTTWRTIVTYRTGYRFTEVKFTADGRFELEGRPNRRITFDTAADTTRVRVRFDVPD